MNAIVMKSFKGVPDGQTQAQDFEPGDMVSGKLAAVAVKQEWAFDPEDTKKLTAEQKEFLEALKAGHSDKGADDDKKGNG